VEDQQTVVAASSRRTGGSTVAAAVTTADPTVSAEALPAPSTSTSTVGPDTAEPTPRAEAAPDLHVHINPTPGQVAAFLAVFLVGLAAAVTLAQTHPAGAHRRH
jgi:hypothetical protein